LVSQQMVTGNNTGLVWSVWLGSAWLGKSGHHLYLFFSSSLSSHYYLSAVIMVLNSRTHTHVSWAGPPIVLFLPCPFINSWFLYFFCILLLFNSLVLYSSLPSWPVIRYLVRYTLALLLYLLRLLCLRASRCCNVCLSCIYVYAYAWVDKNGWGRLAGRRES